MKKLLLAAVVSTLLLSGCSGKATNKNSTSTGTTEITSSEQSKNSVQQRIEVKTDFKPVEPNTIPKLSTKQKSQIDSKVNSTLYNIDKALKSLQDAPEVDLSSLDK